MKKRDNNIFVINTGSTSTKIALFKNDVLIVKDELHVPAEKLKKMVRAIDQLELRIEMVENFLKEKEILISSLDIVVARGGITPPCKGRAYKVNQLMIDVLTYAPLSQHASSLSCMIGKKIVEKHNIPVIVYDSSSVSELDDIAKVTGIPEIHNLTTKGHVLNSRKVGRDVAKKIGKEYEDCRFVIAHFGGSISVTMHRDGKIVDSLNAYNGPMAPQRAGRIPSDELVKLCYSGKYTELELLKKLNGNSGFVAYFGTQDAKEVMDLVKSGDKKAKLIVEAMAYQSAKAIGELSVGLYGKVDRIIFTGGLAYSKTFTDLVAERTRFIAPIEILPGEYEMEALALAGIDVLNGVEIAKEYDVLPKEYKTKEEFYDKKVFNLK